METVSAVFKINKATKAKNAKLNAKHRVDKLIHVINSIDPRCIPLPPPKGYSLGGSISNFTYVNNAGEAAVSVRMFNKAEKQFTIEVCRALGFDPKW